MVSFTYTAPQAALWLPTQLAFCLCCSPSPRTLACSHTAKHSPSVLFLMVSTP